jgi:hypothetical protein
MQISAKWWGLLTDYVKSIKKSVAALQAAQEVTGLSTAHSDDFLPKLLTKPLEPTSASPSSHKQNNLKSHPNSLQPTHSNSSFTSSQRNSEKREIPPVPLPPRKTSSQGVPPPLPPSRSENVSMHTNHSLTESPYTESSLVPNTLHAYPSNPLPPTSETATISNTLNLTNSSVPLTVQMEMALQAAVEDTRNPRGSAPGVANPWGEEEDNVWS